METQWNHVRAVCVHRVQEKLLRPAIREASRVDWPFTAGIGACGDEGNSATRQPAGIKIVVVACGQLHQLRTVAMDPEYVKAIVLGVFPHPGSIGIDRLGIREKDLRAVEREFRGNNRAAGEFLPLPRPVLESRGFQHIDDGRFRRLDAASHVKACGRTTRLSCALR